MINVTGIGSTRGSKGVSLGNATTASAGHAARFESTASFWTWRRVIRGSSFGNTETILLRAMYTISSSLRFVKGKASVLSPGKAAFPTPDAVWNPYKAAFEEQPESPIEQKESRVEKFGDDVGNAADDFDDYDDFEYDPGGDWG